MNIYALFLSHIYKICINANQLILKKTSWSRLNIFSHDTCISNTSLLTHIVKIPILGCPRSSSVNRVQVTRLIAVPSVLIYIGPVAGRVLWYIYTVTIIVSATRQVTVLGERDDVRQQHIEIATNSNASHGRVLFTNSHSSRRCDWERHVKLSLSVTRKRSKLFVALR